MIILFYDINADGKLSFDEFINFVRNENQTSYKHTEASR